MSKKLREADALMSIKGISLNALSAGIYKKKRLDLALLQCHKGSVVSAVFTKNVFCAAPVIISRNHLATISPQYLLINAGNANAGTGKAGLENALSTAKYLADYTGCVKEEVLLFSTGVIGEDLPIDRIKSAIPDLVDGLDKDKWDIVAQAILTTDTRIKGISKRVLINDKEVTITGIVKGSGMIRPDMATMLAFIATDASVEKSLLNNMLSYAVNRSFNRIIVDGDTSTNDACVLLCTGKSGIERVRDGNSEEYRLLANTVTDICIYLAKEIVRDGEGATKFVTLEINGGNTEKECIVVAESIAMSPLVKTALFASDPNWGRILAAIGRSGLRNLDINLVDIYINDLCIVYKGEKSEQYTEEQGSEIFKNDDIFIKINLNRGNNNTTIWTCDLSYDYVKINAEYRT